MMSVCDIDLYIVIDVENAVAVEEWDDFSQYSIHHMQILAQLMRMCTLKRDYVRIGYYAERFRGAIA